MDGNSTLQFWAGFTLIIRTISVIGFFYIAYLQYVQFKYKEEAFRGEVKLKWLLFSLVLAIAASNIPIGYLSLIRLQGNAAPAYVTSWATVTNGVAMLFVMFLLILIYRKN